MAASPVLLVLICALIATQVLSAESPVRRKRIPIYSEGGTAACLRCHSGTAMRAMQSGPHFDPRYPHAPAARHYCESCHGPGSIHVSRAHGGRGFPPLTRFGTGPDTTLRDEQLAICQGCHGTEGWTDALVVFTGSGHDLPDINCSTCHRVHVETDPIRQRDSERQICLACHSEDMADHPRPRKKDIDQVPCADCHAIHSPDIDEDTWADDPFALDDSGWIP